MSDDIYADILKQEGFVQIGELRHRLHLSIWWHPRIKIQTIILQVGCKILVKADKPYYLQSITDEGETWARDIGPLQDYLEAHFPEMHLSFSHFRDVTPKLAATQIRRKLAAQTPTVQIPTVERLAQIQQEQAAEQSRLRSDQNFLELDSGSGDMVQSHLRRQVGTSRDKVNRLQEQATKQREKLSLFKHLQKEYQRKGSAACLVFDISSNTHITSSPTEFLDALKSVKKEMHDLHRYQVTQKLMGGRLNIHVAEAEEPVLVWIEQWLGGALSPRQLTKLESAFRTLTEASQKHLMVTPKQDIQINDHVKDDRKLLAARVTSTLLRRLDRPEPAGTNLKDMPKDVMPLRIGLLMQVDQVTDKPSTLPLVGQNNTFVSGTTGSGKSYLGRVLVEEAAQYEDLNILILDPRNQAAGLLAPEDREAILSSYTDFGLTRTEARGFDFKYYAPAQDYGEKLPSNLAELGRGRVIVSFKGMDDRERCTLYREILDAVFEDYAGEESASPRILLAIEEAHRFTKKRVDDNAKSAGERAENALDRTVREGRKYGCCTMILSQTIRDFAYDSASIRQNTNTKMFLHNSDCEVDYAATFIGDGKAIIRLTTGTAIVYNSAWGAIKVKVRPPLSKVWEFGDEDTRRLVSGTDRPAIPLSQDAQRLLTVVQNHFAQTGKQLNLSQAAQSAGITSKRMLQQLVMELEHAAMVQTRKLPQRGQPRIIEPLPAAEIPPSTIAKSPGKSGMVQKLFFVGWALPTTTLRTMVGGAHPTGFEPCRKSAILAPNRQ